MKHLFIFMSVIAGAFFFSRALLTAKKTQVKKETVELIKHEAEHRVDVMIGGKKFTSYWWPDSVMKPVLYPVFTSAGVEITRGFPIKSRPGERTDHPHHVGIWLNYGNVNGIDFWGNSYEIPDSIRRVKCGIIKHLDIKRLSSGTGEAVLITDESWIDPSGKELLAENTAFHFIADGSTRIIDRITTLTATGKAVTMKDTKEGMFGIRVARQLELPSQDEMTLTDAQGNPTTIKKMSNEGVSGSYKSSEGIINDAVWGTRARWMDLYGNIGSEKVSVVICDHPGNVSYPTYWHARGYGLFCLNPFGAKDFTKGREELNYTIAAGKSITMKYRMIVHSGAYLSDKEINAYANDFAKKY